MHVLVLLLDGLPARLGRDAHLGRCAQGEARRQPWRSPPVRRSRSRAASRRHGGCERGAAARARRRGARTGFGAHGDPAKREVEPAHAAALRSPRGLRAQRDAGYWGHGRRWAQAPRARSFCAGSARAQDGRARLLAPRASAASGCAAAGPRPGSCDEETQSAEEVAKIGNLNATRVEAAMLGLCARRRLLCSAAKVDHFAVLNVQARATAVCPRIYARTLRPIARSHLRCAPCAAPVRSRRAPAAQNVPSDHGDTRHASRTRPPLSSLTHRAGADAP